MPQARIIVESSTNAAIEISTKPAQWQPVTDTQAVKANIRQVAAQMHIERQLSRVRPGSVSTPLPQQQTPTPPTMAPETSSAMLQSEQGFFNGTMEGVNAIGKMTRDTLQFLKEGSTGQHQSAYVGTNPMQPEERSTTESIQEQVAPHLTNLEKMQREMRFVPGEVQIRMVRYPEIKFAVEHGTPFDFIGHDIAGGILNEAT